MSHDDPRLSELFALVESPPWRPWTVDELAQAVHLSPSYLRQLFTTNLGVSPKQYLKMRQLEQAAHLLETTTKAVKVVMRDVGFSDPSHFARNFASRFGVSPSKYRRRIAPH